MEDRTPFVWWYAKTHYLRSPKFMKGSYYMSEPVLESTFDVRLLHEDLQILLDSINEQMEYVTREAEKMGVRPLDYQTSDGDWVMRSLLVGKATVINSMVVIKQMQQNAASIVLQNNYVYPEKLKQK